MIGALITRGLGQAIKYIVTRGLGIGVAAPSGPTRSMPAIDARARLLGTIDGRARALEALP